ncbi:MAG: Amidohydrolase [Acetothermia bacterium 64_32]|nr:MAG: Amidohydrolase [Acetothermia bacterium 64_32]HAF70963.1 putative aminohydrolase SsnA [Candidatus Acetothermia bacterium]
MELVIDRVRLGDLFGTYHEQGYLIVSGDRIEAVGEGPAPEVSGARRIDADGRLLTPGLVNAHAHLYSSLARGVSIPGFSPRSFGEILEGLWWRLDRALEPEDVYWSAMVGGLQHLRAGVTALLDHHASPGAIEGALSQIRRAVVDELGLRCDLCYEVTDRGGLAERDAGIAENLRAAKEDVLPGRCAAHMGLHASFTLSDQSLERAVQAAEPLNLPFHIHLAEGKEDVVDSLQRYGLRVAERLDKFGILREGTLLAHGIHLSQAELELLADRPASLIHNPRSNMNNAVGAAQVEKMLSRGINVGLGTDGYGCDIIGELLSASLLAHHTSGTPTALGDKLLLLLYHNYALAERFFGVPMGKLAPGYAADLVLWDYHPPTPITGGNLPWHLMFARISEGLSPHTVIGAGEVLLSCGQVSKVDEREALAKAREAAKRLWARI